MADPSGSSLKFEVPSDLDIKYVDAALETFLGLSGYGVRVPFADLSTSQQNTVLHMARAIKREMEQ